MESNSKKWDMPCLWNIDVRNLILAREEGATELRELNELSDTITIRSYTVISLLIPIISILIAVMCNSMTGESINRFLFYNSLVAIIIATVCIILFVRLIFPHNRYTVGRDPKSMLTKDYLENPKITGENTYRMLLFFVIDQQQGSIAKTKVLLVDRSNRFKFAIRTLIGGFVIMSVSLTTQAIIMLIQS